MEGNNRFFFYLEAYGILGVLQVTGVISWIQSWISVIPK